MYCLRLKSSLLLVTALGGALAAPSACGGPEFSAASSSKGGMSGTLGCAACTGTSGSGSSRAMDGSGSGSDGNGGSGGAHGGTADASDAPIDATPGGGTGSDVGVPEATGDALDDVVSEGATAADACTMTTFFLDGDEDGYGGTTTAFDCLPTTGHWVTTGGDCDDSNKAVHPAQESSFAEGFVRTGTTSVSFDYDCSGAESESGNPPKAYCRMENLACVGAGYAVATPARDGPGINPYCGSAAWVNCSLSGLTCVASAHQPAQPIPCR
jgi:hypothetical protein